MTINEALKKRDVEGIRKWTSTTPIALIADELERMSETEMVLFFRLLNTDLQSEVFYSLENEYRELLIKSFTNEEVKSIVSDLYTSEIADLVEEMPSSIASKILKNSTKTTREMVNKILKYSNDVVGSVMTIDTFWLDISMTVAEAVKKIKGTKGNLYIGHYFFVVNKSEKLEGYIAIEDLLMEPSTKKLSKFMKPCGFVQALSNKEEAIKVFSDHDMSILPVVDKTKKIIGVITSDDMIDVVQEAASEDFQKMAGIDTIVKPYSKTKARSLFRSRIIWLMLLMISATISQIVLDVFQNIASESLNNSVVHIASSALWTSALVAILPVISGAAGNAGSQSSTMVIRSLALGDITSKDYLKVVWKELKVSILVGFSLALANFVRLILYYLASGDLLAEDGASYIFLALAASISLMVVIILAKIVGGTLPLLAKKMKIDPATMAAPLLTTIIDALSTMIFFGISIGIMVMVI